MKTKSDIDPVLRNLGGRLARYQTLQVIAIGLGSFGAAFQLLDNVFIGRAVEGLQCAAPTNVSSTTDTARLHRLDWNSSHVLVGQCEITVSYSNLSDDVQRYPCPYGYQYGYRRELSFRTEFDLVCDRKLLGSLVQTLLIAGQGVGAVLSSFISDRYGRKPTMIGSQFALLLLGVGIGLAPSYPVLAALKFLIGGFQQGVVTGKATMSIELYPKEHRSMQILVLSFLWGIASSSMALVAFFMRDLAWRYLQHALSAASFFVCLLQLRYMDESLRWLVANGRKEEAIHVLKRAARANGKDFNTVMHSLQNAETDKEVEIELPEMSHEKEKSPVSPATHLSEDEEVDTKFTERQTKKLSVLDLFRHKRLLIYGAIMWLTWYTCAFSYFTVYLMSTTLHGNRFINYFLASLTDFPAGIMLYYMVNKFGRKNTAYVFLALTAVSLISCGVFRVFKDNHVLGIMSVVSNTLGALGATSIFIVAFFLTPELFPTNMRTQALGIASFAGRLGGMMGPFMTDLAEVSVWAPGALIGGLCFLVIILFRFLPETKGRELPHTIEDIESWTSPRQDSNEKR